MKRSGLLLLMLTLALFLTAVKDRATRDSQVDVEDVITTVGEMFMSCQQCGTCTAVCPGTRSAAFSPRQVLRQLSLDLATEQSVDQAVWGCLTCKACEENCPRGIDIIDVMRTVRQLNVDNHKLPDNLQPPLTSLESNGNPWDGKRDQRTQWHGDAPIPEFKAAHDYCLFTCCTTAYAPGNPEAGQALPRLLTLADASFGSLGNRETCCGDPALQMGAETVYRELEQSNLNVFRERGVTRLLVSSPHCLNTFTGNYADLRDHVAIEHYAEVLDQLLTTGRLIPALELNATVTYHDPCYLGRHSGIYDSPRRVLESIPGLQLVEMENNRERSQCCGGGGCGAWGRSPAGQSLGVLRVKEALGTQADIIATACPYCIRILDEAVRELGVADRIVVRDIAELLLKSVEVKVAADEQPSENVSLGLEGCHV